MYPLQIEFNWLNEVSSLQLVTYTQDLPPSQEQKHSKVPVTCMANFNPSPRKENWQREIQLKLSSMHKAVAILHKLPELNLL